MYDKNFDKNNYIKKIKTKLTLITILLFSLSMTSACGGSSAEGIIIAGSTSVQPYVEVLSEEYALLFPEILVDVQGGGSSAGITATDSGTAEIGMSSRALNDKEQDCWHVEIAKDGLAVIIHPSNPIKDLTIEQIRDIYTTEINNWSEVGGSDEKIHIIAREDGSGTRSAFESLVMNSERISPRAIVQDSNGTVKQLVSGDPNSIGFISLGLVDDTVKAIQLEGVAPTFENVKNGSYSLHRPFIFITKDEPTGLTKDFIDYTLSPEGQQILMNEGLIPQIEGTIK